MSSSSSSSSSPPPSPPGLFYYPDVIPVELGGRLYKFLENDCVLFGVPGRGGVVSDNARRVAHYGYNYNYTSGRTNAPAEPFPDIITELCELAYSIHTFPGGYRFDQCIINRYLPGQGINAHYDREDYGEFIVCFTIGSGAEMEFTSRENDDQKYCVYTQPYSMYIMSGPSRHEWLHQMRPRRSDPGHGKRGVRWSLTFRSVKN